MTHARQSPPPTDTGGDRAAVEALDAQVRAASDGAAAEEIDALPVLAPRPHLAGLRRPARALARDRDAGSLPAVQAAAVAAGSFVAGAAVAGLVHRRARRAQALTQGNAGSAGRVGKALARGNRKGAAAAAGGELVQIVGTRRLLVDVHLLGVPDSER